MKDPDQKKMARVFADVSKIVYNYGQKRFLDEKLKSKMADEIFDVYAKHFGKGGK